VKVSNFLMAVHFAQLGDRQRGGRLKALVKGHSNDARRSAPGQLEWQNSSKAPGSLVRV